MPPGIEIPGYRRCSLRDRNGGTGGLSLLELYWEPCQERSENWFGICSMAAFARFQEGRDPTASSRMTDILALTPLADTPALTLNPIRSDTSG